MHCKTHSQRGGITILVALSLLVILSVSAFGLARSSIREAAITGTVSQAAAVRGNADAGLDWAIQWMHPDNKQETALKTAGPVAFLQIKREIELTSGGSQPATSTYISALPSWRVGEIGARVLGGSAKGDMILKTGDVESRFDLTLTFLGESRKPGTTQTGKRLEEEAGKVNVWNLRSDGRLQAGSAFTYTHSRDCLITVTPE